MAKSRKKGKNARRSRQGQLGLTSTVGKIPSKKFQKRHEVRSERKDEKAILDQLKESAIGGKDTIIRGSDEKVPHTFVVHTGKVGRYVRRLEHDLRQLMSPHTSRDLKVTKRNNLKDFIVNGQFLGVSHIVVLTRSTLSVNLRVICCPQGPTIHFKVDSYSLCRDILSNQKRPLIHDGLFGSAPLVVLNGFNNDPSKKHLTLVQAAIQHMFPSINIDTVDLGSIKRVLLANYSDDVIELRHYSIKSVPCGVSKSAKKLLQSKIPDLSKYEDISDFMINPGVQSDSEFEGEQAEIELPHDMNKRGGLKGQKTKIRLLEIGPRMTLKLVKIEEGMDAGEVLFHSFVQKTPKEIDALRRAAPMIRKRRERREKDVSNAAIRRLRAGEERQKWIEESHDKLKQSLIRKQKQVSGEVLGSDDDVGDSGGGGEEQRENPARKRFK